MTLFLKTGIRNNFKNHEPSTLKAAMLRIDDVRKFVQEKENLNYKELQAEAGLQVFTRLTTFEDLEGTESLSEEQQETIRGVIFCRVNVDHFQGSCWRDPWCHQSW